VSTIISNTCEALVWVVPILLVTARFVWPKCISWWLVVALVALLCSLLVTVVQDLTFEVQDERYAACLADPPAAPHPAVEPCPIQIADYYVAPWHLRWIQGVFVLVLLLPVYGVVQFVRTRRRASAA
jgi:hypothetical protein